jgi:hypothetical protein
MIPCGVAPCPFCGHKALEVDGSAYCDFCSPLPDDDVWSPCEDDLTELYEEEEPLANALALSDDNDYEPVRIYH